MRDFERPGRSTVFATNAAAATSHSFATLTAIETLKAGGNAVDAALAASAMLAIVEPQMTGIGGDCFAILAHPDGRVEAINGSGRAPSALTIEKVRADGFDEIPAKSAHAVTVPGALRAWEMLAKEKSKLGLARALKPAIDAARRGVPVAPRVASDWAKTAPELSHPGAVKHLTLGGHPPQTGDRVRFPALADTMEIIATDGVDAFYTGEIAEDLVATLRAAGGVHTLDDFAVAKADWVDLLRFPYRGHEILVFPPNTQAIAAPLILGQMDAIGVDDGPLLSPNRVHIYLEAVRRGYALRNDRIGDPEAMQGDPSELLSTQMIDGLAASIDQERHAPIAATPDLSGSHTVYLTVVDRDGLAVSFINSLFSDFGSKIVTEKTGVTFHNRGSAFRLDPDHPNALAPNKRPLHTLIPGMVLKDARPTLSYGVMGGAYQAAGHAWFLSNHLAHRLDPQAALDVPRCFLADDKQPNAGVILESALMNVVGEALAARGHHVHASGKPIGCGQGIRIDHERGVLIAGSDYRKDGCALGY